MIGEQAGTESTAYSVVRIGVGVLFFMNGLAKLAGRFGWEQQEAFTQLWWAGAIEAGGGFLIALGLVVRPVALLLVAQMITAYYLVHFPRNFLPWANQNGGERAVLFSLWFLYMAARGAGAFSLDGLLAARRREKVAGT